MKVTEISAISSGVEEHRKYGVKSKLQWAKLIKHKNSYLGTLNSLVRIIYKENKELETLVLENFEASERLCRNLLSAKVKNIKLVLRSFYSYQRLLDQ